MKLRKYRFDCEDVDGGESTTGLCWADPVEVENARRLEQNGTYRACPQHGVMLIVEVIEWFETAGLDRSELESTQRLYLDADQYTTLEEVRE